MESDDFSFCMCVYTHTHTHTHSFLQNKEILTSITIIINERVKEARHRKTHPPGHHLCKESIKVKLIETENKMVLPWFRG
jgi:hypothetical protein